MRQKTPRLGILDTLEKTALASFLCNQSNLSVKHQVRDFIINSEHTPNLTSRLDFGSEPLQNNLIVAFFDTREPKRRNGIKPQTPHRSCAPYNFVC